SSASSTSRFCSPPESVATSRYFTRSYGTPSAATVHVSHSTSISYPPASVYTDAGGYEIEVLWDTGTAAAPGVPDDRAKYRDGATISGGERQRLALGEVGRGPRQCPPLA